MVSAIRGNRIHSTAYAHLGSPVRRRVVFVEPIHIAGDARTAGDVRAAAIAGEQLRLLPAVDDVGAAAMLR